jgi:hypothetical protein
MFEEVPCERRGLSRLLPVRRVVLGPFVLGGGMLLAALGGSVAVAATVLTASVIYSDVPPRPAPVVAPVTSQPAAPVSHTQHRPARPATSAATATAARTAAAPATRVTAPAAPSGGVVIPASTSPVPAGSAPGSNVLGTNVPGTNVPETNVPETNVPAATSAAPSPAPSSSGPRGNAVIHVSGYDQATGRFAYQFATAVPQDAYVISGRQTFTAVLAPAATITSGGTLCPPAGSSCTPDQLIAAADSGFFAEVAIDVTGALRSVLEVGDQAVTPKLLPVPSTATAPPGGRSMRSPQPTANPTASS